MIRRLFAPVNRFTAGLALVATLAAPGLAYASAPLEPAATPPTPRWNTLMDVDLVEQHLRGYAAAYPDWVTLESIGESAEGRAIWLVTLTNPATGAHDTKPAMYVDGNTHANEVQGTEATLYMLDFALKNYGTLDRVTELLDRATFYLVPVVNPDGRWRWFNEPATANFPRTVVYPVDDDRDGRVDEDGFDDLDGNGVITQMRKKVPMGEGTHRLDADDPRIMVRVEAGQKGDYVMLPLEGIDNDADGSYNEDLIGYVDPNRVWGYDWQPEYVQRGAGPYPFAPPEARSIALWALEHPNIGAVQTFHNSGAMILRGPGAKSHPRIPRQDLEAFDLIAEEGERMLPGYDYLIAWKDLYTVYGSTDGHFYRTMGAISFTNELYEAPTDTDGDGETSPEERWAFNDLLTLGRQMIDWAPYDHPEFGAIEIGGARQDVGRVPEGWMLEEETHRNAAFVLFHAHHLPRIMYGAPRVTQVDRDLWRVELPVHNDRAIATMTAVARQARLHRPDIATVEGATVIASGIVRDSLRNAIDLQEHRPGRLMVEGVPGHGVRTLFFLLDGRGTATVTYDSVKGGTITVDVPLEATDAR
ncbi:MAG: M14 family metallopeptidase [Acidobacteriota bacterium]